MSTNQPPEPPAEAEAALGALACRFPDDARVSLADIIDVTGLILPRASRLRRWAMHAGRWPYARPRVELSQPRRRPHGRWAARVDEELADGPAAELVDDRPGDDY